MTIIRETTLITGSKRLGVTVVSATETLSPAMARPDPEQVRANLREAFAEELEELREDARKDGLLAAEAQESARLQALEEEQRQWLAAEQRKSDEERQRQSASLQAAVTALRETMDVVTKSVAGTSLGIAYATVVKMLGEQAVDRSLLLRLGERAVAEHAIGGAFSVAVSSTDHACLQSLPDMVGIDLVADESLSPGDCVIRFAQGRIDAGLEQQLTAVKQIFLASLVSSDADA